jgi:hypothetical protein
LLAAVLIGGSFTTYLILLEGRSPLLAISKVRVLILSREKEGLDFILSTVLSLENRFVLFCW